jgi:hypothetical protein
LHVSGLWRQRQQRQALQTHLMMSNKPSTISNHNSQLEWKTKKAEKIEVVEIAGIEMRSVKQAAGTDYLSCGKKRLV